MAGYYHAGHSIECEAASIKAKKIEPKGLFSLTINGNQSQYVKYKCYRDGEATIIKELSPKEHKIDSTAHLDLGDFISANQYTFFHKGVRTLVGKKIPYSGRHNTQSLSTSTFTRAEITKPFDHIAAGQASMLLDE